MNQVLLHDLVVICATKHKSHSSVWDFWWTLVYF